MHADPGHSWGWGAIAVANCGMLRDVTFFKTHRTAGWETGFGLATAPLAHFPSLLAGSGEIGCITEELCFYDSYYNPHIADVNIILEYFFLSLLLLLQRRAVGIGAGVRKALLKPLAKVVASGRGGHNGGHGNQRTESVRGQGDLHP
jgi:hypothetical protein